MPKQSQQSPAGCPGFGRAAQPPNSGGRGGAPTASWPAIATAWPPPKRDRLTEDWTPQSLSPTSIHRVDSNLLLRRARDLVENNPYAKSGVESYVANVVGCGITPKPLLDSADQRRQWVDAWNWWGGEHQNEADLTGQQHLYELMALWLTEVIVGGGCLVRYVALDPDQYRQQRVKLALELIPEERIADEKDDPAGFFATQNRKKSGNVIRRGVELDPATGRPWPIGFARRIPATRARPGSRSASAPRTATTHFSAHASDRFAASRC
jgi:hypothetical protein